MDERPKPPPATEADYGANPEGERVEETAEDTSFNGSTVDPKECLCVGSDVCPTAGRDAHRYVWLAIHTRRAGGLRRNSHHHSGDDYRRDEAYQ